MVRNPYPESKHFNKYLVVNELKNKGWWVPGGGVSAGEDFRSAAIRECQEESGILIDLKGILSIELMNMDENMEPFLDSESLMNVVFYGEPKDLEQAHKLKK